MSNIDFQYVDAETIEPDKVNSESFAEEEYDLPDTDLLNEPKRGRISKQYEKKVRGVLRTASRAAMTHEATVPDAAALLLHAPQISEAAGNLAETDPRIRKAIDFLTEGTENPYAALIMATLPLALQLVRNHEPILVPEQRGIRVPFTQRRIKFKFGIKLGKLRNMTNDPQAMTEHVFSDPSMVSTLEKLGIKVARPSET